MDIWNLKNSNLYLIFRWVLAHICIFVYKQRVITIENTKVMKRRFYIDL